MIGEACRHATLLAAWRQVKGKNAAGGIDGVSLAEFEEKLHAQLDSLASDLRKGRWKPLPYLLIEVSKKNKTEKRELGLLAKHVMERLARYEKYRDKELKMNDIIASQCQDIASYFKDGTRYKPYVAKW